MTGFPFEMPSLEPGWVWLVGAGPGAPELLTLLGWHALRQAEVVVHDALVDPAVLALAPPEAAREDVGKRGGRPSPTQDDISQRLVDLARAGRRVVRLKGGDPFVFGRGPDEALALVTAGVPFRVVPGITAGAGGLAHAGIPATHGATNSAVTFLTGQGPGGGLPRDLDWQALARGSPVLVAYMALKALPEMVARLLAGGRSPDEPVAVVRRATAADQQVLETTLAEAPEAVAAAGLKPPALVVVGEVVRLRAGLDWLGALSGRVLAAGPLRGKGT